MCDELSTSISRVALLVNLCISLLCKKACTTAIQYSMADVLYKEAVPQEVMCNIFSCYRDKIEENKTIDGHFREL